MEEIWALVNENYNRRNKILKDKFEENYIKKNKGLRWKIIETT